MGSFSYGMVDRIGVVVLIRHQKVAQLGTDWWAVKGSRTA